MEEFYYSLVWVEADEIEYDGDWNLTEYGNITFEVYRKRIMSEIGWYMIGVL